jgi:hypothetical protein
MQVSSFVPPVITPHGNIGAIEKRSTLPLHPLLTISSPFELTPLLAKLQRTPEVREQLVQEVIHKRRARVYFTRETAEQTAQTVVTRFASSAEVLDEFWFG